MSIGSCDYEAWRRRLDRLLRDAGGPAGFEAGGPWSPPTDVFETSEGIVVRMELPGVAGKDVSIVLVDDRLVVRGERRDPWPGPKIRYQQMEIPWGPFLKIVYLRLPYEPDGIRANFAAGYLHLVVPRASREAPRRIAVEIRL